VNPEEKVAEEEPVLVFESRFESGNLRRAVQIGPYEYDLILKYDYGTNNYTQWFYFSVKNTKKGANYKFNIINLVKPESSYNQGMKPLVYSVADQHWHRDGTNIAYYQNTLKKKGGGFYYTLTFQLQFKHDHDEVYLSHCYPYTYSDCCDHLQSLCVMKHKERIRRTVLCRTIAGNDCDMVIITNFSSKPEDIA